MPHAARTEGDSNATLCGNCGKVLKEENKEDTSVSRELIKDATSVPRDCQICAAGNSEMAPETVDARVRAHTKMPVRVFLCPYNSSLFPCPGGCNSPSHQVRVKS